MTNPVHEIYGHHLRVRACGICVENQCLLLVNHHALAENDFWSPPGGGISFGESAHECLKREFREETGLDIRVTDFLFACEFIHQPLHAIELFFGVVITGGQLRTGTDPEMNDDEQIIREVKFMTGEAVRKQNPRSLHKALTLVDDPVKISELRGYFRI